MGEKIRGNLLNGLYNIFYVICVYGFCFKGLKACDLDGTALGPVELPKGLKAVGPHVSESTLLQSLATALHVSGQPVTGNNYILLIYSIFSILLFFLFPGQTGSKSALGTNPGVFLNPEQPLVQAISVADEDIRRQEDRVMLARRRLQDAIRM